jgi:tetratricopeptide (TPR) repeat protein
MRQFRVSLRHSTAALIACGLMALSAQAQQPAAVKSSSAAPGDKRAAAYYNFAMGHMYAELAATYGYRSEDVDKAIQHYRTALQLDPSASYVSEELTDLYMQAGKLRDAVTEAEDMLRRDPENLEARRMLGRIYSRLIGDQQTGRLDDSMIKKAIEQYEKVTQKDPADSDSWLMLGRLYKVSQNFPKAENAYKKALELDPDNQFAVSGLAMLYSDQGDSKSAVEMWRRLAEKDPRPDHLRALAKAYEDARDYKTAAQTLRRALEAAPRDPELKGALAQDLLLSDDVDAALKIYGELAAADPKDAQVQIQISRIYREKHDLVKARAAQDKARAIDPENYEVRYNEVRILAAEGKTSDAIARLQDLLTSMTKKSYNPNEQAARMQCLDLLGDLYRSNQQFTEAVEAYRKILPLDTTGKVGPQVTFQIIETYRQAKDFARALQESDAAQRKYPDDRDLKAVRASLLADMGQVDQAAAALRQLLDGKNDRVTYLALAQVYDKGKRFKEEGEALDSADKLSQGNDQKEAVAFYRGAMFEKMSNLDAAETQFRRVLELNPQNASALNYLGYMLADRNMRLEEARRLIVQALDLEPGNGAYLDSLGWVNFRMGKLDDAESNLRQALDKVGNDPTVHDHLGDVYAQKGRLKEAIGQWELSLKEWETSSKAEADPVEIAKVQKKLENARVRLAKEGGASQHR